MHVVKPELLFCMHSSLNAELLMTDLAWMSLFSHRLSFNHFYENEKKKNLNISIQNSIYAYWADFPGNGCWEWILLPWQPKWLGCMWGPSWAQCLFCWGCSAVVLWGLGWGPGKQKGSPLPLDCPWYKCTQSLPFH